MSRHSRRLFWASCAAGILFAGTTVAQTTEPGAEHVGSTSQSDPGTTAPQAETGEATETGSSASLDVSLSAPQGFATSPAGPERANHELFNMHFFGGVAVALGDTLSDRGYDSVGPFGGLGFDYVLAQPLALSVNAGMSGFGHESDAALRDLYLGAGVRLRFLVDRHGPISKEGGNIAGNLWMDAHFNYHNYSSDHHAGFNVGVGYELALLKNFNAGPFARFQMTFLGDDPTYATMFAGLQISIGGRLAPQDKDGDGVEDENDTCPDAAEDKDGFEDEDGCPDLDNDQDGILDADDACPVQAGPADNKGCPITDNDDDGIENDFDKCPGEPEDMDGFEDEDGCPDVDNDGDSIVDAEDKCPNEPEDMDGFEDEDGCPEEGTADEVGAEDESVEDESVEDESAQDEVE